mgnify:FL=1
MTDVNDSAVPPPTLRRYKLTIAYDGSQFHGWQKQEPPNAEPLRTVAGVVEATIARVLKQRVNLVGASRTDAGVHAKGQVAQFDAATRLPIERMAEAINSRLPADVEIVTAEVAPPDFDAIQHVTSKCYRYRIFNTPRRPLGIRHMVYHFWHGLDVERMNDAAARLVGTHDFEGFASAGHNRLTTVRTIHDCRVEARGDEKHIVVSGNGFLYNMVRIIAGTLIEVGRGRFEPTRIDEILASRDRAHAGPTVEAAGLCLEWIAYRQQAM